MKKVETNCILQNCFLREASTQHDCRYVKQGKTYIELQNKVVPDGIKQEYVEVEYPHTAERVASYAEAADYRRDPLAAVAKASPRQNLGDVVDLQKLANMDTTQRAAFIDTLQAAIDVAKKADAVKESAANSTNNTTNNEVTNNE